MEVVNKLIDTEEALANQFDHDGKQDVGTSGAAGVQLKVPKATFRGTRGRRALTFDVQRRGVQRGAGQPLHIP
jgi:hypothetical protein